MCQQRGYTMPTGRWLLPIVSALLIWAKPVAAASTEVVFIDVGEAESTYIKAPDGSIILIDAANPLTAGRLVAFLRSRGVETIDALIITHPHSDHMGGLFQLLSTFTVKRLYDNGQPVDDSPPCELYRWYRDATKAHPRYSPLRAGDRLRFGGLAIDVLWPERLSERDWNNNSLVLRVSYGGRSFLLMGDAMAPAEKELLEIAPSALPADVLKAGHHGSANTLGDSFLDAIAPRYVVISIDRDNLRGYPSPDTLERLKQRGITTLITHSHGNIGFRVWADGRLILER